MILGTATSFFNYKNQNLVRDLMSLLLEANQELPQWLEAMYTEGKHGGSSRRPASKGSRFGAKDYRQSSGGGGGPPGRSNGPPTRPGYGGKPRVWTLLQLPILIRQYCSCIQDVCSSSMSIVINANTNL
jgi:hypothetical protein